jgi:hypothetical protein
MCQLKDAGAPHPCEIRFHCNLGHSRRRIWLVSWGRSSQPTPPSGINAVLAGGSLFSRSQEIHKTSVSSLNRPRQSRTVDFPAESHRFEGLLPPKDGSRPTGRARSQPKMWAMSLFGGGFNRSPQHTLRTSPLAVCTGTAWKCLEDGIIIVASRSATRGISIRGRP